jgi:SAM-dependent methyltransferase
MLPYMPRSGRGGGQDFCRGIFPDFLAKAKARVSEKGLANVTSFTATIATRKLPAGSVDAILVLDVYHHFDYPAEMLASLAKGLKKERAAVHRRFLQEGFSPTLSTYALTNPT